MSPTVLVTDGDQRSALASVRSLGRAGHEVHVASRSGRSLSGASRWARTDHQLPDPLSEPGAYAQALADRARVIDADVVLPVSDSSILGVLPSRRRLEDATVPYGGVQAFRDLSDKHRVAEAARAIGLRVPRQWVVESEDNPIPERLQWPVVVKPSRSVASSPGDGGRVTPAVSYASSHRGLESTLRELSEHAYPVLLQERIRGAGIGVFLLRARGETVARFGHRRLREKPPSGGVSVYRESVAVDTELLSKSERLVSDFDWSGLAMVEFKVERESGMPFVMEVNARPWGSLQLAIDAGVDFPRLLVESALGLSPESPVHYETGIRSRWFWGDVDHLIARLKGAVPGDRDPGAGPDRLHAFVDFLTWRAGDRLEVLRLDDVRPFLRESADWIRGILGRRG